MSPYNWKWAAGLSVVLAAWPLGRLAQRWVRYSLGRVIAATRTKIDDVLIGSLINQLPLWALLGGLSVGLQLTPGLSLRLVGALNKGLLICWIAALTVAAANIAASLFRSAVQRAGLDFPQTSLTENVIRGSVFGIGALMLLANLGISIAPALTALGVGSLAVALALQDTLSNFFAGLHILLSRPITIGDYIKLDSGQEGYVSDVGWRATRIKEIGNNIIVVPNAKLAQAIITNTYLPDRELAVLVEAGVPFGSDLDKVERVVIEVAREVMGSVPGGVPEFEPFMRYHAFGDTAVNFTVVLRGKEFANRFLIAHEFIKHLRRSFEREGIEDPIPQRVIHTRG